MLIAKILGDYKMTVYVCLHCEYRFDTEKGDPAYNIPAGKTPDPAYNIPAGKTPADMPEDWVCPECAALGIDAFIVEEE